MRPFPTRLTRIGLVLSSLALIWPACGPGDAGPGLPAEPAPSKGDPEANRAIQEGLNEIVNEAEAHYKPLKYQYDEGLLKIVDQVESSLSGKAGVDAPRFMPKLEEAEERDHLRETIRRWEELNGKSLRVAINPLIAEVADRKPDKAVDPDFHKRFAVVFDSFIPIEIKEARERKNRAIHAKAEALLAPYQAAQPDLVDDFRKMLTQQYPQATPAPATTTGP